MPASAPSLRPADVADLVRHDCFDSPGSGRVGIEVELLTFPAGDPQHRLTASELRAAAGTGQVATAHHGRVTLEPGGQIEISSLPHPHVGAAIAATESDLGHLRLRLHDAGVATTALGLDPVRHARRILDHPRYAAMEAFFDTNRSVGPGRCAAPFGREAGATMMCNTASMQVNVDLGPPERRAWRWRLAHALGPVLVATFANSPYIPVASPTRPLRSARQLVWAAIDRSRTASPLGPGPLHRTYAAYALDASVMFIRARGDHYEPTGERFSFRSWLERGHPLGYPTADDVGYHLTTLFPPVRPRGWLELRYLDALPDPWWQVAAAVTVALLDDPAAAEVAGAASAPVADRWLEAASVGLNDPGLGAAARACFTAALEALPRVGCGPDTVEAAAEYFGRYTARRRSPADDLLDAWGPRAWPAGTDRLVADPLRAPATV